MQDFERKDLGLVIKNVERRQGVFARKVVVETENKLVVLKCCRGRGNKLIIGLVGQRHVLSNVVCNDRIDWHLVVRIVCSGRRIDQLSSR